MNIFKLIGVTGLMFLLSGCPATTGNTVREKDLSATPLPHPIQKQKALVYLVQPAFLLDFYFVVGTASEGWDYGGSNVYIQPTAKNSHTSYLGKLYYNRQLICFYADPGDYRLNFQNKGGIPSVIDESVHLDPDQVYFFGLNNTNYSSSNKSKIEFTPLTINMGKNYLEWYRKKNLLPSACVTNVEELPNRPANYYYVLKVVNSSDTNYQIIIQDNNLAIDLSSHESYQFAPQKYYYLPTAFNQRIKLVNQNNQKINTFTISQVSGHLSFWFTYPTYWFKVEHAADVAHQIIKEESCITSKKGIDNYLTCTAVIDNAGEGQAIY